MVNKPATVQLPWRVPTKFSLVYERARVWINLILVGIYIEFPQSRFANLETISETLHGAKMKRNSQSLAEVFAQVFIVELGKISLERATNRYRKTDEFKNDIFETRFSKKIVTWRKRNIFSFHGFYGEDNHLLLSFVQPRRKMNYLRKFRSITSELTDENVGRHNFMKISIYQPTLSSSHRNGNEGPLSSLSLFWPLRRESSTRTRTWIFRHRSSSNSSQRYKRTHSGVFTCIYESCFFFRSLFSFVFLILSLPWPRKKKCPCLRSHPKIFFTLFIFSFVSLSLSLAVVRFGTMATPRLFLAAPPWLSNLQNLRDGSERPRVSRVKKKTRRKSRPWWNFNSKEKSFLKLFLGYFASKLSGVWWTFEGISIRKAKSKNVYIGEARIHGEASNYIHNVLVGSALCIENRYKPLPLRDRENVSVFRWNNLPSWWFSRTKIMNVNKRR